MGTRTEALTRAGAALRRGTFTVAALMIAACGGSDPAKMAGTSAGYRTVSDPPPRAERPIAVAGVTLGRGIGPDGRVETPTDTFAPDDVIYASVVTRGGAGEHELAARWRYLDDAQEVATSHATLTVDDPGGARTTEFHVSRKKPWPAGRYRLELSLDGRPAGERELTVAAGGDAAGGG